MISGTHWTDERALRAQRLEVPPGFRLLTALETVEYGDLTGSEIGWRPVNPINYGSEVRMLMPCARRGDGLTETWIVPTRVEDFACSSIGFAGSFWELIG